MNGALKRHIVPSRGLRQGDTFSPYFFLLCIESLVCLLKKTSCTLTISRIKVCKRAPSIKYLLLANNSVLFCKVDVNTNRRIQRVLAIYEEASGQCINSGKMAMVLANISPSTHDELMDFWTNVVHSNSMKNTLVSP